ncbi:hypothetical protein MM300_03005 [Evansella sp. LMS18]|uniref:hypothetical protein n=1 Tax=Evansella sp. LMS18 TaxID=2924033 RepID=UPI0020D1C465|nr:hypothetical protein [Evansella sp. LMS18]UTR11315.1 hypothetical protein MM300_03005 [Evansella sp. LMS18]
MKKMLVLAGIAQAENPFLTAFSRKKLVEAVPAESVRLKRKIEQQSNFFEIIFVLDLKTLNYEVICKNKKIKKIVTKPFIFVIGFITMEMREG